MDYTTLIAFIIVAFIVGILITFYFIFLRIKDNILSKYKRKEDANYPRMSEKEEKELIRIVRNYSIIHKITDNEYSFYNLMCNKYPEHSAIIEAKYYYKNMKERF